MFEFLFKYSSQIWQDASLFFASGWSSAMLIVACLVVLLVLAMMLAKSGLAAARKFALWVLQGAFACLMLAMLWQPSLRVDDIEEGENNISILFDTSRSMALSETGTGPSRLESAVSSLDKSALLKKLQRRFDTDVLSFSNEATSLTNPDVANSDNSNGNASGSTILGMSAESANLSDLVAGGVRTNLLDTLESTLRDSRQDALAGVVVISDGADNGGSKDSRWWRELAAFQVPVYTVAVGPAEIPADIELSSIDMPGTLSSGGKVPVRISITHDRGGQVTLKVFDGQNLLLVEDVTLPDETGEFVHTTYVAAADEGVMDLRFELDAIAGESTLANNQQRRIVPVRDDTRRVLYVEGEPRWEYKFIRRALEGYKGVELVSLLRTSPNKFYRQGVRDAEELKDGFPTTREALFDYDAVIIGSLEAAQLTGEQQKYLRDFVRTRGGSLVMLAGKQGLADGGWGRSEVAQALPVVLSGSRGSETFSRERQSVMPTALGEQTAWLLLDDSAEKNREAWAGLPEIADFQRVGEIKPGASVLLQANDSKTGMTDPLLAWQRYGRGKSFVMATSGSWRWQMGLPSDDLRHERFWQGFLSHVASGSLPRMAVNLDRQSYADESRIAVSVTLRDPTFEAAQNATPKATLHAPDGTEQVVALAESAELPGHYLATLSAPQSGEYKLTVADESFARPVRETRWLLREDSRAEDFSIRRNDGLLKRIADETGGEFLHLAEIEKLPDVLGQSSALLVRTQNLSLWNMPVVFLFLMIVKLCEWALRWRWGRI